MFHPVDQPIDFLTYKCYIVYYVIPLSFPPFLAHGFPCIEDEDWFILFTDHAGHFLTYKCHIVILFSFIWLGLMDSPGLWVKIVPFRSQTNIFFHINAFCCLLIFSLVVWVPMHSGWRLLYPVHQPVPTVRGWNVRVCWQFHQSWHTGYLHWQYVYVSQGLDIRSGLLPWVTL